jgi:hypothetical protein
MFVPEHSERRPRASLALWLVSVLEMLASGVTRLVDRIERSFYNPPPFEGGGARALRYSRPLKAMFRTGRRCVPRTPLTADRRVHRRALRSGELEPETY